LEGKEERNMGQKVNPIGLRIGINKEWQSKWFADRQYREYLCEDLKIRDYIKQQFKNAGIPKIEIERKSKLVIITIWAARPGMVIGHGGRGIEQLRQELAKMTGREIHITVKEVENPELEAQLVAENIAQQIERRISWRRAMRQAILRAMNAGAQGIKVTVGGRLGGIELARDETLMEGKLPLHTLRADIDYGFAEAKTKYGMIGVHVWIYRGDIIEKAEEKLVLAAKAGKPISPRLIVATTELEGEIEDVTAEEA